MRLGVSYSWIVVDWWERVALMICSDARNGVCNCTGSAHSIHWIVRVCPESPIEEAQTVESVTGTRGNGVVCLLCLKWWMKEYDVYLHSD